MKAFGIGCLELAIVWVIVGCGLHWLFQDRFTPPGPKYGAILGGMFVASGWGLFRNALQAREQVALIRRSLMGDWPRDGAACAAVGPAVTLGQPLLTPFQRKPCVLYSYELSRTDRVQVRSSKGSRTETRRTVYLSGIAMVPWEVRSHSGSIKVVGFPVPDQFPVHKFAATRFASLLRSFHSETEFTDVGKWEVGKMIDHAKAILTEDDGQLRQDLRFEEATLVIESQGGLEGCELVEQYIPIDESICVLGSYDGLRGGLVNRLSQGGLQALPGDAQLGMVILRTRSRFYGGLAIILVALGTLGSFGLLTLRENSHGLRADRDQAQAAALVTAMEAEDIDAMAAVLKQGASPNVVDNQDRPILHGVTSQAMFDLLVEHGVSLEAPDAYGRSPLLAAMSSRNSPLVQLLLKAGVDVNRAQEGWGRVPLEVAFDRGDKELMLQLRELGATGKLVTRQSGQPLTDVITAQFVQLLQTYSEALDSLDASVVESVTDQWPQEYFERVQRGLYSQTRPVTWQVEEGYVHEDVATVIAVGQSRSGGLERYVITFIRRENRWRIRRDHWDERHEFAF